MAKFYRVIKDHPVWEVGAILSDDSDRDYLAIDDLYCKDIPELKRYYEIAKVVENSPEFFERVYKVSVLKQVKYLAKDAARKAQAEQYKS